MKCKFEMPTLVATADNKSYSPAGTSTNAMIFLYLKAITQAQIFGSYPAGGLPGRYPMTNVIHEV